MRWEALFSDLEAQFEAAEAANLADEVADRSRREAGLIRLVDRLRAGAGRPLAVCVPGAGQLRGRLLDSGPDWLLLDEQAGREAVVPLAAVLAITGLTTRADSPNLQDEVSRRLDLRWALRGLARSRTSVSLVLGDGSVRSGTLDRVAADHLDLAEHAPGEARRAAAVRQVTAVPLAALSVVRST